MMGSLPDTLLSAPLKKQLLAMPVIDYPVIIIVAFLLLALIIVLATALLSANPLLFEFPTRPRRFSKPSRFIYVKSGIFPFRPGMGPSSKQVS
jgi:hypothetical protein